MKRYLLIILLFSLAIQGYARTGEKTVSKSGVMFAMSECKNYEGVDLVSLGRFSTFALKQAIRFAAKEDPDAREALDLMKGIHRITVMDYESCSSPVRARISRRLENALSGSELLMEAGDSGDKIRMYGLMDEKVGSIKDFVLFSPSDYSLICIFGSISMDAVAKLSSDD